MHRRAVGPAGPPTRSTALVMAGFGLFVTVCGGRSVAAQGSRWTQLDVPRTGGQVVRYAATAYDSTANRLLSYGGEKRGGAASDELWALDLTVGAETWTRLNPSGTGPRPSAGWAAFDALNNRMVLILEYNSALNTWFVDFSTPGGTWRALDAPEPVKAGPMVYHAPTQRMLMVAAGGGVTELWSLDLRSGMEAWTKLDRCGSAPPSNSELSAVLDAANDQMIVVRQGYGDVWSVSLAPGSECWGRLSPGGERPRQVGAMVYDGCPSRRRMLFFGNTGASGTVALRLPVGGDATFELVDVSGSAPPARWYSAQVLDPIGQRLVTAYGSTEYSGGEILTDAWALELGPCSAPTDAPSPSDTPIPAATATRPVATDLPTPTATSVPGDTPTATQPVPSVTPMPLPTTATPTVVPSPTGAPPTPTPTDVDGDGAKVFLPFAAASYVAPDRDG